jgi:esterase/lipase superfamily enzyme
VDYPDYLLADRGLTLSDNSPIQPGETKDITVTVQDARWDTERLSGLAYDVDSSFAGVLFFFTASGTRYPMEVGGSVIPIFGEGAEAHEKDPRLREIFFATNRKMSNPINPRNLSDERSQNLTYGAAVVRVPEAHKFGTVERPQTVYVLWIIPTGTEQETEKEHFVIRNIESLTFSRFLGEIGKFNDRDTAIVFVHGFDNTLEDALYKLAQIVYDMNFKGIPLVFSWPSKGGGKGLGEKLVGILNYERDRESASDSRFPFLQLLDDLQSRANISKICIIAHSMGSQVVVEALASAQQQKIVLSELIFAAPDVDRDVFISLANRLRSPTKGVTLYASHVDRALFVSGALARGPRAGDVPTDGDPVVVPGIDTIDVTALGDDLLGINHDEYSRSRSLIEDIGRLILDGTRPPDQRSKQIRRIPEGSDNPRYWKYPE